MKQYLNGQSGNESYSGSTYGGINLNLRAVASAVNVPLVATDTDIDQINVKVVLHRVYKGEKMQHEIVNANLKPIAFASGYDNANFGYLSPASTGNDMFTILVEAGVAVEEIGLQNVYIPFGGVVDTTGNGGELILSVTCGKATFTTATLNTNLSNLQAELVEVEGIEDSLPVIVCDVIDANQVSPEFTMQGLVKRIVIVNQDKTSVKESVQVVSMMSIQTDRVSRDMNIESLNSMRNKTFESLAQSEFRCQTYELLSWNKDKVYQEVRIKPTLNTANVTASQNWFVGWGSKMTLSSLQQYENGSRSRQQEIIRVVNTLS